MMFLNGVYLGNLGAVGLEIEPGYWLNQTTGELRKSDGTTVGYYSSIADAKADIALLEGNSGGPSWSEGLSFLDSALKSMFGYKTAKVQAKYGYTPTGEFGSGSSYPVGYSEETGGSNMLLWGGLFLLGGIVVYTVLKPKPLT